MSLKRNEDSHPEWVKKDIIKENNINLFDRTEHEAMLFWSRLAKIIEHIQSLDKFIGDAHLPLGLIQIYVDLISAHLETVKDLLFASYGLILDTSPDSKECVTNCNRDNLMDLGFWALDNQAEIEIVCNTSGEWPSNNLHDIEGPSVSRLFKELFSQIVNPAPAYLYEMNDQLPESYMYAPYQIENRETIATIRKQIKELDETMRSIFSVILFVQRTTINLIEKFELFLDDFKKSERGEKLISGWRNDYYLTKEQLLSKLKEKKDLTPWVDKVCMLYEGKIEKKELFIDITNPAPQHNPEMYKTCSWISIFNIYAIMQEYDDLNKNHQPPKSSLPECLKTPEAEAIWERLRKAGFIVKDGYGVEEGISNNQAAYIASCMADKLKIKNKWKTFEQLWNLKNLAQLAGTWKDTGKLPARYKEIDDLCK
ncbi:MAG: hypothetical protein IJ219_09215 [Bacteroidaceae bacterium]|nr:hypothetical protein [Bacteroidaceae bacterium]